MLSTEAIISTEFTIWRVVINIRASKNISGLVKVSVTSPAGLMKFFLNVEPCIGLQTVEIECIVPHFLTQKGPPLSYYWGWTSDTTKKVFFQAFVKTILVVSCKWVTDCWALFIFNLDIYACCTKKCPEILLNIFMAGTFLEKVEILFLKIKTHSSPSNNFVTLCLIPK